VGLGGKVGTNATMGPVGSSASLGSSIDGNVVDGEVLEVLSIGVGLEVVDQSEYDFHGLLGPSSEGLSELGSLTGPADSAEVGGVGDAATVSEDVLEVLLGLGDCQTLHCLSSLIGILIMDAEVSA
jgi:hypothetical protein